MSEGEPGREPKPLLPPHFHSSWYATAHGKPLRKCKAILQIALDSEETSCKLVLQLFILHSFIIRCHFSAKGQRMVTNKRVGGDRGVWHTPYQPYHFHLLF